MKALVIYNEEKFLVPVKNKDSIDYNNLFALVNHGKWPDECHDKDYIISRSEIVAYFTDESELIDCDEKQ